MSRRTSEATKAIALAWQNEQDRVRKGQGTRDWTKEQQKDILELGKAYDEDGRAFEGQHMRSAEKHPEVQGDPDNIQFLTRQEHFEAHDFNWQNPTNWYYDPVKKVKIDFGEGPIIPCQVITLSEPIVIEMLTSYESALKQEGIIESQDNWEEAKVGEQEKVNSKEIKDASSVKEQDVPKHEGTIPNNTTQNTIKNEGVLQKFLDGAKKVWDTAYKNRKAIELVLIAVFTTYAASKSSSGNSKSSGSNQNNNGITDYYNKSSVDGPQPSESDPVNNDQSIDTEPNITEDVDSTEIERSSPQEHEVSGHKQHYNTKNGRIEKEIKPYKRGKNKDNE